MNEQLFVKPVGHTGQFVLATGELCQNGSFRELHGTYQSPKFRSFNEACKVLFGTTDLYNLALLMQKYNMPLLDRLNAVHKLMVLRRAVQDKILPEKTPKHVMDRVLLHYSEDEADQAIAALGF